MVFTAGSLPEVASPHSSDTLFGLTGVQSGSTCISAPPSAPSASVHVRTYDRLVRPFNTHLNVLPGLHPAMRQWLFIMAFLGSSSWAPTPGPSFRARLGAGSSGNGIQNSHRRGCHGLPIELGRGSGVAKADRACMLCGRCPGDNLHLVLECFSFAGLRDDMPALLQNVPSMRSFMWQESMMLMFDRVQGAMRMLRAVAQGMSRTRKQPGWLELLSPFSC